MNHSDTALTDKESDLVNTLASRLRLVQADLATVEGEERRLSLKDEVDHAFKDYSARDRQRLLAGLLRRFPVAGQPAGSAPPPPPVAAEAPAETKPETPDELFARFLSVCGEVSAEQRAEWVQRLAGQGMVQVEAQASEPGVEISAEWLKTIGLDEGDRPQLDRVFLLLGAVSVLLQRLDQATDKTMQELNVRSSLVSQKRTLSEVFKEYLVGGDDTLDTELQGFSARLGSLVTGMLVGGRNYGNEFLKRCSPMAIEEVVKTEGRHGFRRSVELCCWEKYKDLARGFATADLIDRQIKDSMAKVVKSKLSR